MNTVTIVTCLKKKYEKDKLTGVFSQSQFCAKESRMKHKKDEKVINESSSSDESEKDSSSATSYKSEDLL